MASPPGALQLSLQGVIIVIEPGGGKSTLVWIGSGVLKPFGPLSWFDTAVCTVLGPVGISRWVPRLDPTRSH